MIIVGVDTSILWQEITTRIHSGFWTSGSHYRTDKSWNEILSKEDGGLSNKCWGQTGKGRGQHGGHSGALQMGTMRRSHAGTGSDVLHGDPKEAMDKENIRATGCKVLQSTEKNRPRTMMDPHMNFPVPSNKWPSMSFLRDTRTMFIEDQTRHSAIGQETKVRNVSYAWETRWHSTNPSDIRAGSHKGGSWVFHQVLQNECQDVVEEPTCSQAEEEIVVGLKEINVTRYQYNLTKRSHKLLGNVKLNTFPWGSRHVLAALNTWPHNGELLQEVFSVWFIMLRSYNELVKLRLDIWSCRLSVGQPPAGSDVTTEKDDVGIRYQTQDI